MLFLRRPTEKEICAALEARKSLSFSYPYVGATRTTPPPGWRINTLELIAGRGRSIREQLVAALFSWKLLAVAGIEVFAVDAQVHTGTDVAILSRHFAIWSLDFCRVIYVLNQEPERHGAILRTGFAYGTLPGHAVRGEEIFSLTWSPATEEVRYEIFSFSKLASPVATLLSPVARAAQKRFALSSLEKAVTIARSVDR